MPRRRTLVNTALTAALAAALAVTGTTGAAGAPGASDIPGIPGIQGITGLLNPHDLAETVDGAVNIGGKAGRGGGTEPGERNRVAWAGGKFAPPRGSAVPDAVTYDRRLVPPGASVSVAQFDSRRGTTVALGVRGLRKDRGYGAHVHTRPCGPRPEDSGPHYQNVRDPRRPSTDPQYANPENEVWLDFTTDEHGEGEALSSHRWHFRAGGARSVVIHEHRTRHDPGHAGEAGRRVACLTVPFHPAPKG